MDRWLLIENWDGAPSATRSVYFFVKDSKCCEDIFCILVYLSLAERWLGITVLKRYMLSDTTTSSLSSVDYFCEVKGLAMNNKVAVKTFDTSRCSNFLGQLNLIVLAV